MKAPTDVDMAAKPTLDIASLALHQSSTQRRNVPPVPIVGSALVIVIS